jgi:translation initiation factor 2B subunit (eIF-2B alpha/beta/delta family)
MVAPKSNVSKNDPHRQEFMDILLDKINEVNDDLECNKEGLIEKASEHINDGDLILTYGCSTSLIEFLIEAKASARFEVIVCESAPTFSGHKTAKILAEKGI